jgi:hypothetical protein
MVDVTDLETRQSREGYDTMHLANSKPFSKYIYTRSQLGRVSTSSSSLILPMIAFDTKYFKLVVTAA